MSKHIAFLSAAAVLAASILPAAAADYDGGDDGPLAYHSRDDVYIEGGRAHIERRQELRPADRYRGSPGPVAFDERSPDRRHDAYGYDDGGLGYRPSVPVGRFGYDRPVAFVPRIERPYAGEARYGDGYRPAAVGPAFGGGYGGPDEGCTIERARSITPAGWEKTVTHRTCYRR